ncbi:MAG: hypothetical protein V7K68_31965 [Nostoc sp.]|uniref:hypothetical protein n=1 Tax=Nostoc sp. TaxID=1180 RepID=UPI002FF6D143
MGIGNWALGIGDWDERDKGTRRELATSLPPCPMPHAPCPMPHAPCPMPHAPCPMPHAQSLDFQHRLP